MDIANDLMTKKDFSITIVYFDQFYSGQYFISMNKRKSKKSTFNYKKINRTTKNPFGCCCFFLKRGFPTLIPSTVTNSSCSKVDSARVSALVVVHRQNWRGRGRRPENCQVEQEGYSRQLRASTGNAFFQLWRSSITGSIGLTCCVCTLVRLCLDILANIRYYKPFGHSSSDS